MKKSAGLWIISIVITTKCLKLTDNMINLFVPTNGIIQGCPLSMLILTSLTACWHESINITRDNLHPRSYADDLSATVAQRTESQLKDSIRQVHSHTQNFAQVAGLKINQEKLLLSDTAA